MKKLNVFILIILFSAQLFAQTTLFKNVDIFDGNNDQLSVNQDVLIEKNLITKIGKGLAAPNGAEIIDGQGKTLMPGLHDTHTHISIFREISDTRSNLSLLAHGAVTAARVEGMLMNGFTTIVDVGGPAKYMQNIVEAGLVPGPRIFTAEALITQTSGHGDFRNLNEKPPYMTGGTNNDYDYYVSYLADSPDEVRRGVRENLRKGATHIKLTVSGGVSSNFDPLHSLQFTPAEVKAAVEAAASWKTFVMTHAYTDEAVRMSVENGVKVILHAPLITDETAKLMAENGIYMNPNLEAVLGLEEEKALTMLSPAAYKKWKSLVNAYPLALKSAMKYNVKMVFGTDLLAPWDKTIEYDDTAGRDFLQLVKFMSNAEALKMATSNAAEMERLTGPNNPWQEGPLGVVEEGAYADLLLIDGNPLENIEVMVDPDKNFKIIMKDGKIYKNTLGE